MAGLYTFERNKMLNRIFLGIFALVVFSFAGCSGYISTEPGQQVDVSGKVNGPDGKPLNNVLIYFQATAGNAQGVNFPIKDGKFSGKMNAGKYTYYIGGEGSKFESSLKPLPKQWKEPSMDRQIEAKAGELEIKF